MQHALIKRCWVNKHLFIINGTLQRFVLNFNSLIPLRFTHFSDVNVKPHAPSPVDPKCDSAKTVVINSNSGTIYIKRSISNNETESNYPQSENLNQQTTRTFRFN